MDLQKRVKFEDEEELDCGVVVEKKWSYIIGEPEVRVDVSLKESSGCGDVARNIPLDECPEGIKDKIAMEIGNIREEVGKIMDKITGTEEE